MTRIDIDGEDAADGLIALVVAVIELLVATMEREAVRRMDSGRLSDEEVEQLGTRLASIESELDRIKADADVQQDVEAIRAQLNGLVDDAVRGFESDHAAERVEGPLYE